LADWALFIQDHRSAFGANPVSAREFRKPQRNYGVVGRSVRNRTRALVDHYQFASEHLSPSLNRALLNFGQIELAQIIGRDVMFRLWLGSSMPYGQKQEGELTVWLAEDEGRSLARAAFSFGIGPNGAPHVLIGGLQGLEPNADKRLIVNATRKLSGLRPKDAVLTGVQAVARALGIDMIFAVSNATHVLSTPSEGLSGIRRDYDAFWVERGGEPSPGVGFCLPHRDYEARLAERTNPRILDQHRATLSASTRATLGRNLAH
jgi:uncharacterized protein